MSADELNRRALNRALEGLRMLAFSDPGAEARDVRFRPLV